MFNNKHVACIDATAIAEFDSYNSAMEWYNNLEDIFIIRQCECDWHLYKSHVAILPLEEFLKL